jgi:hypothetical protein
MTTRVLENVLKCLPTYYMFYRANWNNTKQVQHVFASVGWVSKFLVLVGSIFHKIIHNKFWFHF